jgi:predicted transcriptional regulator
MSDYKASITFRTDVKTRDAIDEVAKAMDRDRSFVVKEAVAQYLDLQQWQIEHIKTGVADADAGRFVDEAEIDAFFDKWADAKD